MRELISCIFGLYRVGWRRLVYSSILPGRALAYSQTQAKFVSAETGGSIRLNISAEVDFTDLDTGQLVAVVYNPW